MSLLVGKRPVEYLPDRKYIFIETKLARQIALAVNGCSVSTEIGGRPRLKVPFDLETVQKVANWSVPVLSPMLRDYEFVGRFKPYLHQLKICSFLTTNRRAFCLADMGTGKSASVAWSVDYLFKHKNIKRVLIVGALSNMKSTWVEEFFAINPTYRVTILHGSKGEREALTRTDSHVFVVNHDGVEVIQDVLLKIDFDVVVVDELTAFKNDKAKRFKALFPICQKAPYVWGLTGTPMPNRPDEVYGQIKMVNPAKVEKMSAFRFKELVMQKYGQFLWKPRFDSAETVRTYMQPAIKVNKADVLILPNAHYEYVEIPLTKGQALFYKEMKEHQFVGNNEVSITAVNGGALMNKLLQVATGAIYNDQHDAMVFDVTPRIEKTVELIKTARARSTDPLKGKTIVFAPFRHTIAMLEEALAKQFNVAVITGDTSANRRAEVFQSFQTSNEIDVILAVARTMSHGVTATAASTIVWFGPVTSNETYQQACNRINRPGQTQEMFIYHLYSTPVEKKLYKTLQQRKLSQADLLSLYSDFIRGI